MNNKRTILCPCCLGDGGLDRDNTPCPLCTDHCGMVTQEQKREWIAVGTLIRFADLPIPSNLARWRNWIEAERGKNGKA